MISGQRITQAEVTIKQHTVLFGAVQQSPECSSGFQRLAQPVNGSRRADVLDATRQTRHRAEDWRA